VAGEHPEVVARMVAAIDNWYPVTQREVVKEFK